MTINIAIAVSEGLVMAADSLSQMTGGNSSQITVHQSVEKITEISGKPIAVMISGIGELKKRTIISLIREFEFDAAQRQEPVEDWTVTEVASRLMDFMRSRYEEVYPPQQGPQVRPDPQSISDMLQGLETEPAQSLQELGLVIGGYSPGQFFPEVVEIVFPGASYTKLIPSNEYPEGSVFIDSWGYTTAVDRILKGYDARALYRSLRLYEYLDEVRKKAGEEFEKLPAQIRELPMPPPTLLRDLAQFDAGMRMRHRLLGMPLQEAVEFAEYLGNVAIGFDRFSEGPAKVGGELDVVAIQPEAIRWYKRKEFLRDMARARKEARDHVESERFRRTFKTMTDAANLMAIQPPTDTEQSSESGEPKKG